MVLELSSWPSAHKYAFTFLLFDSIVLIVDQAYGRVANLKSEAKDTSSTKSEDKTQSNLVEHFTALLLAVFIEAGLLKVIKILSDIPIP